MAQWFTPHGTVVYPAWHSVLPRMAQWFTPHITVFCNCCSSCNGSLHGLSPLSLFAIITRLAGARQFIHTEYDHWLYGRAITCSLFHTADPNLYKCSYNGCDGGEVVSEDDDSESGCEPCTQKCTANSNCVAVECGPGAGDCAWRKTCPPSAPTVPKYGVELNKDDPKTCRQGSSAVYVHAAAARMWQIQCCSTYNAAAQGCQGYML
jgi:hypothetical protein